MPRRKAIDEPPAPPESLLRPLLKRWVMQLVALLAAVGLISAGVIWLSNYAREQIQERARFQVALADIECNPPTPLGRPEFLEEVQFYSRPPLPERFSVLDKGALDRLKEGFAQHPGVAKVEKVEVVAPRAVRVTLAYRQPVLAVVVPSDLAGSGFAEPTNTPLRAVDIDGVLLPKKTPLAPGMPVLHDAPPPTDGEGKFWGDADVLMAAQTVLLLKPQLGLLRITEISRSAQGLIFWGTDVKAIWGKPTEPGKGNEATFAVKEQRLTEAFAKREPLPWWTPLMHEYDLRPREAMTHRWVPWRRP